MLINKSQTEYTQLYSYVYSDTMTYSSSVLLFQFNVIETTKCRFYNFTYSIQASGGSLDMLLFQNIDNFF